MKHIFISLIVLCAVIVVHAQDTSCDVSRISFVPGVYGQVTPGDPNNVRDMPSVDGEYLGEISGEGVFRVVEGPVCQDDFVWWKVNYRGLIGWTAGGTDTENWLTPLSPETMNNSSLSVATLPDVDVLQYLSYDLRYSTNSALDAVAFSPDGTLIAGGVSFYIIVWDVETGEQIQTIGIRPQLSYAAGELVFSDDNRYLAWRYRDGDTKNIMIYDLQTKTLVDLITYDYEVTDIAFVPFSHQLLIASDQLYRYHVSTGQVDTVFEFPEFSYPQAIDFNLSGEVLAVAVNHTAGLFSGRIYQWDWATGESRGFVEILQQDEEQTGTLRHSLKAMFYWQDEILSVDESGLVQILDENGIYDFARLDNEDQLIEPVYSQSFLLVVTDDYQLYILNVDAERWNFPMRVHTATMHPAGAVLATSRINFPVTLWHRPE